MSATMPRVGVKVAERDLPPGLGLRADYTLTGDPGRKNLNLDAKRRSYSVGLDVDLNLDQKPERHALRGAQIALQRSERQLELAEENVRKDIRSSWRNLEVARKQYELAQESLALGEERLQLEEALYEADRGSSHDLIDAQQDLVEARDQLTAALINHTLARIQLWKNIGILFIRKDGSWADVLKKECTQGRSTMKRSGSKRWWIVGAAIIAVTTGYVVFWGQDSSSVSDVPTFVVQRGNLQINVLQGGEIRALKNYEVKSEIEYPTKILSLIPEGYLITEEDVKEGKVLVELDGSELKDKISTRDRVPNHGCHLHRRG